MSQDLPTGPSQPTDYDKVRKQQDTDRAKKAERLLILAALMEDAADGDPAVSQALSLKRIADFLENIMIAYMTQVCGGEE